MSNAAPKTLGDLVTPKQLWMIRATCREQGLDAEAEAQKRFGLELESISKRAASQLIEALKGGGEEQREQAASPQAQSPANTIAEIAAQDESAKPLVRIPKPYARPIAEIMADLSKPIAPQHLESRKQGGKNLTFIPWHRAVRYLDYYAPGWNYEVRNIFHLGGRVALVVRISIPCAEGVVYREATGQEEEDTSSYGDPTSNAESMALRRAAAKFGLGLYLYDK